MPSLPPFISRQDVVDRIGRGTATDPGILSAVDAACDMVRTLSEQTFNEVVGDQITVDGTGTDAIVLPQLPVNNVGTVELIDNEGGTTAITDYVVNGHGVLLRQRGSVVEDWPSTIAWPVGRQNVQVTYDHGYGTADLPRDVREVALSIAARKVVQGAASEEQMGSQRVRYGTDAGELTKTERAILNKYRQIG